MGSLFEDQSPPQQKPAFSQAVTNQIGMSVYWLRGGAGPSPSCGFASQLMSMVVPKE